MAGELNIRDEGFANELYALPLPMAFIDFEAFMPQIPGVIPGTMPTDNIPCQWSCHTIFEHGVAAADDIRHGEYLWTGDVGWNPIYSFVQSLYEETADCGTIAIYTQYEIRCLKTCKQLAENDINRWRANELLSDYYTYNDEGDLVPLASCYKYIYDWLEEQDYDFYVQDTAGNEFLIQEIIREVDEWYNQDPLPYDYLVVNADMEKVPLMDIAPYIGEWCDEMMMKFYDLCYGSISKPSMSENHDGGVEYWIQSPDLHNSNSIKHVLPAAMAEYSQSADLLVSQGLPATGYDGLRAAGGIAKGDECTTLYLAALNRPVRPNARPSDPSFAPFDQSIIDQCLTYCCLDTLSMVIIYLAVMEATDAWCDDAYNSLAEFVQFDDDGLFHFIEVDPTWGVMYKGCDTAHEYAYQMDEEVRIMPEADLENMPIRDQYALICPRCRRLRNQNA